jgi:hypothetical protein
LPDRTGPADQFVVENVVCSLHRRSHGRHLAVPCPRSPASDSHR